MKFSKLINLYHEKLIVKSFIKLTGFIITISLSFTFLFVLNEIKEIKYILIKNGELTSSLLAQNIKLGVFTEDKILLQSSLKGILKDKDILEILILTAEGDLLIQQKGYGKVSINSSKGIVAEDLTKIFKIIQQKQSAFFLDDGKLCQFWTPVKTSYEYPSEESILIENDIVQRNNRIIGYVGVIIDKKILDDKIAPIVFKSIVLALLFIIIGLGFTFLVVKDITTPLKNLTKYANLFKNKGLIDKVPIETKDEISVLVKAFNEMVESLKKHEAEKNQLEEKLKHSQKLNAVGTLAGGIAHEFNNFLSAIKGYGYMIKTLNVDNEKTVFYAEQILNSSSRASRLTQSLLAFSRKQNVELKPVNFNNILNNVQRIIEGFIEENIDVTFKSSVEDLFVMADIGLIEQVLVNFATNARDAMPDGGFFSIIVDITNDVSSDSIMPGKYVLITITDSGIGINKESLERIFEPFYTTKDVGKGTGLGLSLAHGIIEQHKGFIEVSSELTIGTSFKIYLPLINKKPEIEQVMPAQHIGGNETILIAEDDTNVREVSKAILIQNGYTVIEAIDGQDAIRKFIENKDIIDLVILDVIMPKINGKDVYEKIKNADPELKTLLVSGYAPDIIHKKWINDDFKFIPKPIDPNELLQTIRKILDE